jgi:hypothetical protein
MKNTRRLTRHEKVKVAQEEEEAKVAREEEEKMKLAQDEDELKLARGDKEKVKLSQVEEEATATHDESEEDPHTELLTHPEFDYLEPESLNESSASGDGSEIPVIPEESEK